MKKKIAIAFLLLFLIGACVLPVYGEGGYEKRVKNGHIYYVGENETYMLVMDKAILWMYFTQNQTEMWIGIDNRSGIIPDGTTVHAELYDKDTAQKKRSPVYLRLKDEDGKELPRLPEAVTVYIQNEAGEFDNPVSYYTTSGDSIKPTYGILDIGGGFTYQFAEIVTDTLPISFTGTAATAKQGDNVWIAIVIVILTVGVLLFSYVRKRK